MKNTISIYERYMNDQWYFGLLLSNGRIMGIQYIEEDLGEYLRVSMLDSEQVKSLKQVNENIDLFGACNSRLDALVRKEHIMAIFELADT